MLGLPGRRRAGRTASDIAWAVASLPILTQVHRGLKRPRVLPGLTGNVPRGGQRTGVFSGRRRVVLRYRRVVAEKLLSDAISRIAARLAEWPTPRYGLARGFTFASTDDRIIPNC